MANPSNRWDFVPVWGVYLNPVTNQPSPGQITFAVSSRITRVDGRIIYPDGATVKVTVGDSAAQDSVVREAIRAAWRAYDEANDPSFDGTTWDVWWSDTIVPALICTRFPASDDPDIVQTGYSVTVTEALMSGGGKKYSIQPLLAQLDTEIPGINLGTVEVPPNSPSVPAPMYAKGVAGGVASLDENAKVPAAQIPDGLVGGATTIAELTDVTMVGEAVATAADAAAARDAIGAQPAGSYATAAQGALADTAVQPAGLTKTAVGLGNVDNTADVDKPISAAQAVVNAVKADLVAGKIPASQIPDIAITAFLGTVASQAAMLALTGQQGDWAIRSDTGLTWVITGSDPTLLASWTSLSYPGAPVTSINGQTGAITIEALVVASASKTTPVDADVLPIVDSAASNVLKKLTWANLKATLLAWIAGVAVRVDTAAQGLTGTQQSNARTNIGAGTSNLALGLTAPDALGATVGEISVEYDGSAWPARPSTSRCVVFKSTKYSTAPSPADMVTGDEWAQHPDAA